MRAEDIHTSILLTEPLLLALPPNHHLCEKDSIDIVDLKNERFLLNTTSYGSGVADDVIEACQKVDLRLMSFTGDRNITNTYDGNERCRNLFCT